MKKEDYKYQDTKVKNEMVHSTLASVLNTWAASIKSDPERKRELLKDASFHHVTGRDLE